MPQQDVLDIINNIILDLSVRYDDTKGVVTLNPTEQLLCAKIIIGDFGETEMTLFEYLVGKDPRREHFQKAINFLHKLGYHDLDCFLLDEPEIAQDVEIDKVILDNDKHPVLRLKELFGFGFFDIEGNSKESEDYIVNLASKDPSIHARDDS